MIWNSRDLEMMEEAGQRAFVKSDTLPSFMSCEARLALEKMGVIFHDRVKGEILFQHVTLPEGWSRRSTEHVFYSELVNDKGAVVAEVFYKASSHDKRATLSLRS